MKKTASNRCKAYKRKSRVIRSLADWLRWCRGGHGGFARRDSMTAQQRRDAAYNAAAVRWGLPKRPVLLSMTDVAIFKRACRALARRRADFDGVKYDDRMSWDPIVIRQVCEEMRIPFRDRGLEKRRAAYDPAAARVSPRLWT
jgi:hypothetical protein